MFTFKITYPLSINSKFRTIHRIYDRHYAMKYLSNEPSLYRFNIESSCTPEINVLHHFMNSLNIEIFLYKREKNIGFCQRIGSTLDYFTV